MHRSDFNSCADLVGKSFLERVCKLGKAPLLSFLVDMINSGQYKIEDDHAIFEMALSTITKNAPTGMDRAKLLVEKGKADVHGKFGEHHSSLFPYVAGSPPMMQYLMDAGADPKETNDLGETVLFKAVNESSWDLHVLR